MLNTKLCIQKKINNQNETITKKKKPKKKRTNVSIYLILWHVLYGEKNTIKMRQLQKIKQQ